MNVITLQEFKRLSGISDSVLVHLLCSRNLRVQLDAEGALLIDIDDPGIHETLTALTRRLDQRLDEHHALIRERVACIVREELTELVALALRQAAQRGLLNPGRHSDESC